MEWVGPTWIEIDLDAVRDNLAALKSLTRARICPVVKSDAYGHGLAVTSMFLQNEGVHLLAVGDLDEALTVRRCGVTVPILVLTPILPQQAPEAVQYSLSVTVTSEALIQVLAELGRTHRRMVSVHLKINTGMNRIGIDPESARTYAELIAKHKFLKLEGVYTHFADADHSLGFTKRQLQRLLEVKPAFEGLGYDRLLWHAAGSSAFFTLPESHLDLVRIGSALFGQTRVQLPPGVVLRNTWNLYTRVVQVQRVAKGEPVGYNQRYTARHDSIIGIIPVGYSDGLGVMPDNYDLWRHLRSALAQFIRRPHQVSVDGRSFPIVGKIAMGLSCIDLTEHPLAPDLYGTAVQVHARRTTINRRIPKVYYISGKPALIHWHGQYWQPLIRNGELYARTLSLQSAKEILERRN